MSFIRRLIPRTRLHLPAVDVITTLTVAMLVIQLWLARAGGPFEPSAQKHYLALALSWDGISHFKFWQVFTHALTHGSWFHLLVNLLMLWLVGGRVIHILGQKRFVVILFSGILLGAAFHVLTDYILVSRSQSGSQLVGISGGCIALLLTLTTLSPDSRMWPVPISGKNLGLGLLFAEFLLWLMTPGMGLPLFASMGALVESWGGGGFFQISHACHFGGGLAGWLLARRLLAPAPTLEDLKRARARQESKLGLGDSG